MSNVYDVVTEPMAGVDGLATDSGEPERMPQMPPLTVSALMVTKADLIAALRIYLPSISDLEAIDGDRFLLSVSGGQPERGGA